MSAERRVGLLVGALLAFSCAGRGDGLAPLPPLTPTPDAAFRASPPALGSEPLLGVPNIQIERLANGLDVVVVERRELPIVSLAFASSRAKDDSVLSLKGLAAFTALAIGGRDVRENEAEDAEIEDREGTLSAKVSSTGTIVELEALARSFETGMERLSRAVRRNDFDPDSLELARGIFRSRVATASSTLAAVLKQAAVRELYGEGHPMTLTLADTESVNGFSVPNVMAFHARHYGPRDAALVVSGDVTAEQAFALARRWFGDWAESAPAAPPKLEDVAPPPGVRPRTIEVFRKRGGRAFVTVVTACPELKSPEGLTFDVIASHIEHVTQSQLAADLRHESGASYTWGADCVQRPEGGTLFVISDADPARVSEVLGAILDELERLVEAPMSSGELETAKASFVAGIAEKMLSNRGVVRALSGAFLSGWTFQHYATLEQRVRAITPEALQHTAARYLSDSRVGIAVMGDDRRLPEQLALIGDWKWSDPRQAR